MGYETLVNSEECRFLNDEEKGLTRKILVNFYCENRKEIEDFLNKTKFPIRRIVKPEEFDEAKEIFEKYHDHVNKYELYGAYISIMLGKEKKDEEEKYCAGITKRREFFSKYELLDWKKDYTQEDFDKTKI